MKTIEQALENLQELEDQVLELMEREEAEQEMEINKMRRKLDELMEEVRRMQSVEL